MIHQIEPDFDRDEERELLKVMRSGWISESTENKEFERMVSEFLGGALVATVPNGTQAITVSCLAAGIEHGDEVLVPDMTMAGSVTGIILAGGVPVFVDVSETDLMMRVELMEKALTERTKAILPVHFNGRPAAMQEILQFAKVHKLKVIEDAAQAFGSKWNNAFLGTIGELGCFSFSVPKVVTTGQGGMVVTKNKVLYERVLQIKDHGRRAKGLDIHDSLGFNFKFTNLQAAVGVAQMRKVEKNLQRKKAIYAGYQKRLAKIQQVRMLVTDLEQTAPWFVDIFVPKRDALAAFLLEQGVETRAIYQSLHSQLAFQRYNNTKSSFPVTERVAQEGLWLPSSVHLKQKEITMICALIKTFYATKK